jgi:hypothetical protein
MNISLRKGSSLFSIDYVDGDFSNNLYCSNSRYIDDNEKVIQLDFHIIINSRSMTNSKDDLDDLKMKVDLISTIYFTDSQITNILFKKLKQKELVLVRFIADIVFEKKMRIIFISKDQFHLIKE